VEFEIINSLEICEVQKSWNNAAEPGNHLPPSELNPLTNATLGQNLGRWAQVYFTTAPDQREQAVSRLLRELESENSENKEAARPSVEQEFKPAPRLIEEKAIQENWEEAQASAPLWLGDVLCPACQHRNTFDQKFCGSCGSPLQATQPTRTGAAAEVVERAHPEGDMQWLREKAVASLDASDNPKNHAWVYLVACIIVLLAGVGYLQWASQPRPPAAAAMPPAPATSEPAINASQPRVQVDAPESTRAQKPVDAAPAPTKSPAASTAAAVEKPGSIKKPSEPSPAAQNASAKSSASAESVSVPSAPSAGSSSVPSPEPAAESEGGMQELLLAQGYLQGKHGARDTTEAGKWLWKAVSKKNSTAALLLADLYTRGDGVAKNCDQARILLVSATKKGAPQAAQALRNLETTGCQ
jgi:hypothetical protein